MSNCKARSTPCEPKIGHDVNEKEGNSDLTHPKEYREIVGSLIYAMTVPHQTSVG